MPVRLIRSDGSEVRTVDDGTAARLLSAGGWREESAPETATTAAHAGRVASQAGLGNAIRTGLRHAANTATVGLTGAIEGATTDAIGREELNLADEAHPTVAIVGDIAGMAPALATGGEGIIGAAARGAPIAKVSRLGSMLARTEEGAGLATKVARSALGAGTETALYNVGQVASDAALSDDPVTLDHLTGAVTSGYLFGGPLGAAGGTLEHGLGLAGRHLDRARIEAEKVPTLTADLAGMDAKALREAKSAEESAIEAVRVPQRAQLATDINAFREAAKVEQPWVAVATGSAEAKIAARKLGKAAASAEERAALAAEEAAREAAADAASAAMGVGKRGPGPLRVAADEAAQAASVARAAAEEAAANAATKYPRWMREQQKLYIEGDKYLDRVLRNPKALAERPQLAKAALQQQEHALELITSKADELSVFHVGDRTGRRAAALEAIPATLERNRALQRQIDALAAAPASERLNMIADAQASIGARSKLTTTQKLGGALAGGAAYMGAHALGAFIPGVNMVAPVLAGLAGSSAIARLGSTMAKVSAESLARQARAVAHLLSGVRAIKRVAPPLASKVLAAVRFAPPSGERRTPKTLEDHFEDRRTEIARQVTIDPTGRAKMRPEARVAMASRIKALAHAAPAVADKMETAFARRIEFLAEKMPKLTVLGMTAMRSNEGAIRAWARIIAAADDPGGVEERVAHGNVTSEDRDVMKALYPDRYAAYVADVVGHPEKFAKLPFHSRLALSIYTGAAVDASTDPRILAQLQAPYAAEPNTEGGTQAPMPKAQFGSVSRKPDYTPAQSRASMA